ncbi:hypothetical protein [Nonomuraea sp. NPDC049480]|uniref:hypothetical protein n=1 Tax=Nonomuraea sp. NPDC049480 TaxID=3364353 RepID=UPI0037A68CB8
MDLIAFMAVCAALVCAFLPRVPIVWAVAALAHQRRTRAAAARTRRPARWTSPERVNRWGRWATVVAVVIPATYDASRIAWALGFPLGITEEFWRWLDESGLRWGGLFLSAMALGGAVLTLGLVQRWGEVYPRWIWFKAGKRVPPMLAVVPASIVAVAVTSAGLMYWRLRFVHGFTPLEMWATWAPSLLWPLWGVALGAATLAYYLRRRQDAGQGLRATPSPHVMGARRTSSLRR